MAFLFMDSFDHYATADIAQKWAVNSGFTITAADGRRSSASVGIATGGELRSPTLTVGSQSVAIVGFALKPLVFPSVNHNFMSVFAAGAGVSQVTLGFTTGGALTVKRGGTHNSNDGALLGTSVYTFSTGTYVYLECMTTLHDSTGTVDVHVNGVSILSLTGQDTNNGGSNAWTSIFFGSGASLGYRMDDLYVCDGSGGAPWNTFLGDVRVDPRYPTGAGATTGWTPSTGANWQCVDDATPNGDTDYVSAATTGLTDTYALQDAPVAGASLVAVQVNINHKKSDSGACALVPVVRHSGTDYLGATISPLTAYSYSVIPYATNPGTSAAWTEADFNAAEFGYKRTA
jgi:hypothetical protein